MGLRRVGPGDVAALTTFLIEADLSLSGLDAAAVRLWIDHDADGRIVGSAGFELSPDGQHALIRSVAVGAAERDGGRGTDLARFAMARAAEAGATTAWLFSRRSGPFWQRLGFESAERDELAAALAGTHQVGLFRETGQLEREVAWTRSLEAPPAS